MAPNKFEKHIKEQLDSLEIKPSAEAWQKLSGQLDAAVQPKKKGYLWYGIAASFIGLIILTFVVNSESLPDTSNIQIINSSNEMNEATPKINVVVKDNFENVIIKAVKDQKEKVEKDKLKSLLVPNAKEALVIVDEGIDVQGRGSNIIDTTSRLLTLGKSKLVAHPNINGITELVDPILKTEELIDAKVLEILAKVSLSEDGFYDINSIEVDSLLRKAQDEIIAENSFKNEQWIDATSLLVQVEDELNPTFRDKIFMVLENKLMEASSAVATRNN